MFITFFLGNFCCISTFFLGNFCCISTFFLGNVSIGNELLRISVSLNVLLHHIPNLLQNHNKFGMGEGERLGMMEK